jgi:hypothetical protein
MRLPRSIVVVFAGVLLSVVLGGGAWARPVDSTRTPGSATPASYGTSAPRSASAPVAPTRTSSAPSPAPGAPAAPSRSGHIARQASVSVVVVLLAIVTLFLV